MKAYLILPIIALLTACAFDNYPMRDDVPKNVLLKYAELSDTYKDSLGAILSKCTKNDEVVFQVSGSGGGFIGISYYYTTEGSFIYKEWWSDDMIRPIDENGREIVGIEPVINLREYECAVIKRSK